MNLIPCYCCGNDCKDQGERYKSTCHPCMIEVENYLDKKIDLSAGNRVVDPNRDPTRGNGYPFENGSRWMLALDYVKSKRSGGTTTASTGVVNDHTCPTCGNNRVSKAERSKNIPCWSCGGKL